MDGWKNSVVELLQSHPPPRAYTSLPACLRFPSYLSTAVCQPLTHMQTYEYAHAESMPRQLSCYHRPGVCKGIYRKGKRTAWRGGETRRGEY